jgi:hypothetical protein
MFQFIEIHPLARKPITAEFRGALREVLTLAVVAAPIAFTRMRF